MALISITQKSQLNLASRIDAEHYSPRFHHLLQQLRQIPTIKLRKSLAEPVKTGHTPSMKVPDYYTSGEGIKFIKTDNLREDRIETFDVQMLSELGNQKIQSAELKTNDVIVTIIGATEDVIGRVARVSDELGRANINQNIALIRSNIPSGYLTTFLNSKFGKGQLIWLSRQTGQVNLNCREVEEVLVPIFPAQFTQNIHQLNLARHNFLLSAKKKYFQAEKLLLSKLGLLGWKPKNTLSFVRNYNEATQVRRIDAEYFQPKYDEIISTVKKFQPSKLIVYATPILKTVNFNATELYHYIEISDVNASTGEVSFTLRETKDLPANAKIEVKGGELLVSKVRPTRGAVGIVPDKCAENGVASGAFTVYKIESPMREFLQVFLRSIVGKMQLEKPTKGTSYPTIENIDVNSILIPSFNSSLIKEISDLVKQSHEARREANRLLQLAKRAVEIAIEEDEQTALEFIESA